MINGIGLLCIFLTCAVASLLFCGIAKTLFPKFRSGEHKPGTHRPDLPTGLREIKSYELPLVGGPAFILAILGTGIGAGYFLHFKQDDWTLLLIGLGAILGYALIGFIDDWRKVYYNEGIREIVKGGGVLLVSMAAAALYFFLLPNSGREPYSLWSDLPLLNGLLHYDPVQHIANTHLLCTTSTHNGPLLCIVSLAKSPLAYFVWLIVLMLVAGFFGSLTSLSVDFSDGLDGLAGGLVFSASLAMAIAMAGLLDRPGGVVMEVLALLGVASTLGFLPWNWPSGWAARRGTATRRAKIIMGDSGALGLGGLLAVIAIFSRNEILLPMIGGAFVLEGASALIQSRILTPFFRRNLQSLRYSSSDKWVPHTEFPLPFLATPLHHHFDLLGWDRRRLVYSAWVLGACFALLGAIISLVAFPWQRYVLRILVLILAAVVWSSGSWSKAYFIGKHPPERTRRRRLALCYGYPYRIMGIRLYHLVEIIEASENVIETPAEESSLWERMSIFDARAALGLYCYRAGYYPAALAQWSRIPERNLILRPEIAHLLADVDGRLSLEKQETQPMKRDEILRQQAIFNSNLPPADLPNPHEPVSPVQANNGQAEDWNALNDDEEEDEEQVATTPLSNEIIAASNGHNPASQAQALLGASPATTPRAHWLTRLLRLTPK